MQASRVINQTRTQTFEEMIGDDPLRDDCFDPNEELNCPLPSLWQCLTT